MLQEMSTLDVFKPEKAPFEIQLDNISSRKQIAVVKKNGNMVYIPLYTSQDPSISGKIQIYLGDKIKKNTYAVKIELIGKIKFYHPSRKGTNFLMIEKTLGMINKPDELLDFAFENFPKKYETYTGSMVEIKYYLLATLTDGEGSQLKQEQEFALYLPSPSPINVNVFAIQIGVLNAVEVDLEYKKTCYHLQECITGRVLIHLVQIEIRKIELFLVKMENEFSGAKSKIKEEVMQKVVLKEGQPKKGELIPLKIHLASLNLSPTMINVENKLSVKYYLTLGLLDYHDRMFFRKVEITLRRGLDQ